MKKLLTAILILIGFNLVFGQELIINNFDAEPADTNYWGAEASTNADWTITRLDRTFPTDNPHEGTASMRLDYNAQNVESWGGYVKIEHFHPEPGGTYDWSNYENLSIWYYTETPQSAPGAVHFRLNLTDISDLEEGADDFDVNVQEYYYSFHYDVLDDATAQWHEISIPLISGDYWNGEGFNRTGWTGVAGNNTLDLDKIKSWHFEFSIAGGGEGNTSNGVVRFDKFALTGAREKPFLIFNGKTLNNAFGGFTWGQSTLGVIEGAGEDPATNALRWVQGDEWANGWTGAGYNIDPPQNLGLRWDIDSLKFKYKVHAKKADFGAFRFQFESGAAAGKVGYAYTPMADGNWHEGAIPLTEFYVVDDLPDFDPEDITVFQIMSEGNAVAGNTIDFDYIWTGSPFIDVVPPADPTGVDALTGDYSNVITWIDVPNEEGEVYNIYYSFNPIAAKNGDFDVVAMGIEGGNQAATHVLTAPLTDQDVTYYYAVECVDAAGNASGLVGVGPVTNTAEGIAVIVPEFTGFAADGDLSEWANVMAIPMYPDDGSGTVVNNTTIDGDADLSLDAYLAMDSEYLYFAADVEDDVIDIDSTDGETWMRDGVDLFIGLYNQHGMKHTFYQRGAEPDYHFRFNKHQLFLDNGGGVLDTQGDNYYWQEKFPTGYIVEGRVSFQTLADALDDELFTPIVGMRIPIDYSINDADGARREGILTLSIDNQDQSWNDPSRWVHTWIGDQMVDVDDDNLDLPLEYALRQNYPNPFNPATKIEYSIKEAGLVQLRVYNLLGQEVATLVNKVQNAGSYEVDFDASKLSSGIYIYRMEANSYVNTLKMILLK